MKMMDKINKLRDVIRKDPYGQLSQDIQAASIEAIFAGLGKPEWRRYMTNFCSNPAQLERLCGNDQAFMTDPDRYGTRILSYIAGGGPCGGGTCLAMAADMNPLMRVHLDKNVTSTTGPGECKPLPEEVNELNELVKRALEA